MKIFKQIGLAYRAKKITLGTDKIIELGKKGKLNLIIISDQASYNTQKLIQDKLETTNIPMIIVNDEKQQLAQSIGKKNVKVLAIQDKGFAKTMLKTTKGE